MNIMHEKSVPHHTEAVVVEIAAHAALHGSHVRTVRLSQQLHASVCQQLPVSVYQHLPAYSLAPRHCCAGVFAM
jgi:hypothetical protein